MKLEVWLESINKNLIRNKSQNQDLGANQIFGGETCGFVKLLISVNAKIIWNNYSILYCREWYSYHFPELVKIVNDNYLYAKTAKFIGNRKEFTKEKLDGLEEVVMDSGKARAIYDASRSSMGKMYTHYLYKMYLMIPVLCQ